MKKNTVWSALLVGIFVTMILLIISLYLFEKIVPFSREIKGVENGNVSYYRANTALNEALLSMSGSDPSIEGSSGTLLNGSGSMYQIKAMGTTLPEPGKGNSEYDKDWAIIAPGKPVQLILKSAVPIDWSLTSFNFRVPDLDNDGVSNSLSGGTSDPIINWTLTASGESLQASGTYSSGGIFLGGSYIMASNINSTTGIFFNGKEGTTLSGSNMSFNSFYWDAPENRCTGSNVCTLKLSLINPLVLPSGESAPYLEYQAHFNTPIPLQTAVIETQGYMGGFRKNITRFVQQMTTNEALDFTVFQ